MRAGGDPGGWGLGAVRGRHALHPDQQVTAPVRGGEALEAVAELQAEVRALREQLSRMEQWVFAVDVSVGELDDVVSRRFRGLES